MIFSENEQREGKTAGSQKRPGSPGPPAEEMIPAKFNARTELALEFTEGIKDLKIEIQSK
jgi:hypothetical protein